MGRPDREAEPWYQRSDADPYQGITREDLRPLTAAEREHRDSIGYPNDFYVVWVDAGYTPGEIERWYPVVRYRSLLPGEAERLIAHLWQPEDVLAVRAGEADLWFAGQNLTLQDRRFGRTLRVVEAASLPAAVVLLDHLARWYDSCGSLMREQRDGFLLQLIDQHDMDQVVVGRLLGISKQRVNTILTRIRRDRGMPSSTLARRLQQWERRAANNTAQARQPRPQKNPTDDAP